jgi:hypothetical protein
MKMQATYCITLLTAYDAFACQHQTPMISLLGASHTIYDSVGTANIRLFHKTIHKQTLLIPT